MKITKQIITILLILTTSDIAHAQFWKSNALYFNIGTPHINNYKNGSDIGLNYIYKQKYSFQLRTQAVGRKSNNVPRNYHQFLGGEPYELVKSHEILIGKIYNTLDEKGRARINLKIGLSYTIIEIPTNFIKKESSGEWFNFSSSHDYTMEYNKTIGLVINPSIEFPLLQALGVSFSPYININTEQTLFGFQFGVITGILRKRIRKNPKI